VSPDGTVDAGGPGETAYAAGLSNGAKLIAVNGRRYSADVLNRALVASKDATGPMELIVDDGGAVSMVKVDYHGGVRIPHLQRVAAQDDVLTPIASARVK
jgi:predicted metalloprotease with PDZ domain